MPMNAVPRSGLWARRSSNVSPWPMVIALSVGVVGAALTLFGNLLARLGMADWAWWIVQHWQDTAPTFWDRFAAWFGLDVPSALVPPLNLAAFLVPIISQRKRSGRFGGWQQHLKRVKEQAWA